MTKLKTLKDFKGWGAYDEIAHKKLREEIMKWIKKLEKKEKEHWDKLDKYHYVKFSETKKETAYGFEFEGVWFESWHEASDVNGAIKILKLIHNISDEDLK